MQLRCRNVVDELFVVQNVGVDMGKSGEMFLEYNCVCGVLYLIVFTYRKKPILIIVESIASSISSKSKIYNTLKRKYFFLHLKFEIKK